MFDHEDAQDTRSADFSATRLDRRRFLGAALLGAAGLPQALAAEAPATVSVVFGKDGDLLFKAGDELVARYNAGKGVAKPFLWPILAPGGIPVTRAWPMEKGKEGESTDHIHQKSAWFCHGDIIPEGIELNVKSKNKEVKGVDFWSEEAGHGRIVSGDKLAISKVGKEAQIVTTNEWRTADDVKILDEQRRIQLYDLGGSRLFVFDIDLHASVCPLTFGDTKEGSMGIRINDAIREMKGKEKGVGKLENADGKVGEKECWGQQSAWCDYSGPVDGKVVGLAIFDDPNNVPKACWHARGYGLMAANPFGRKHAGFPAVKDKDDLFKLAKGQHLKLRYGLYVHTGDAKEGKVEAAYQRFVKLKA
jgi:hypothetical protein